MTTARPAPRARRVWSRLLLFLDQRWIHFLLLAMLMTAGATALHQGRWGWAQNLDNLALDGYFELRGARAPRDVAGRFPHTRDIVLIEMRHSVPRPLLGRMLGQLRLAKVVAFDLMFRDMEAELSEDELPWYQNDIRKWRRDNALLGQSIRAQNRVVLGMWPEIERQADSKRAGAYFQVQKWRRPPRVLTQNARGIGHLKVSADPQDQTVRAVRLFEQTPQKTPCLGLSIAELALGRAPILPPNSVDSEGRMLIDYAGGRESYEFETNRIVYERVLDLYEPEDFANKIVLIGESGATSKDILTTPFGAMPGMQIHANIVATLLDSKGPPRFLSLAPTVALSLGFGLCLALFLFKWPLWAGFLMALTQIGVLFLLGAQIFIASHHVLQLSLPVMAVALTFNALALYEYRRARETLGKFIGREMVAQTLQVFSRLQLGGRTEEASAFFCDVRGYSTLSESRTPDEIARVVNQYTQTLSRVMKKHQGRLIDYQGDGVFVLFERSLAGENHAEKAVRAGIELQEIFERMRLEWAENGAPELEIGIGIETGLMTIGIVGAPERMMLSALGHAVNVAARVQGLTAQCGYGVLLTHNTFLQVGDAIPATFCGSHTVKGLERPIMIYGVSPSSNGQMSAEEMAP